LGKGGGRSCRDPDLLDRFEPRAAAFDPEVLVDRSISARCSRSTMPLDCGRFDPRGTVIESKRSFDHTALMA
jgi:hypothetical protein